MVRSREDPSAELLVAQLAQIANRPPRNATRNSQKARPLRPPRVNILGSRLSARATSDQSNHKVGDKGRDPALFPRCWSLRNWWRTANRGEPEPAVIDPADDKLQPAGVHPDGRPVKFGAVEVGI